MGMDHEMKYRIHCFNTRTFNFDNPGLQATDDHNIVGDRTLTLVTVSAFVSSCVGALRPLAVRIIFALPILEQGQTFSRN